MTNITLIKSLIKCWAPKPTAIPTTPKPANTGPTGIDSFESIINIPETTTIIWAPPVKTLDKVVALFSDSSCSPYSDLLITKVVTTLGKILSIILTIHQIAKIIKIMINPSEKNQEKILTDFSWKYEDIGDTFTPIIDNKPTDMKDNKTTKTEVSKAFVSNKETKTPTSLVSSLFFSLVAKEEILGLANLWNINQIKKITMIKAIAQTPSLKNHFVKLSYPR